jgi:hypothetical protein
MTDRELLEAAAKAASYLDSDTAYGELSGGWPVLYISGVGVWDPLGDDGDALRLAVRLDMNVFQSARSAYALPSDDDGTYEQQVRYSDAGGDPYAATRRAIVRAAATMAQTKEG